MTIKEKTKAAQLNLGLPLYNQIATRLKKKTHTHTF
ncbi:MAG: hypothetical protein ACI8RD_013416, partial [Bacillariaceae sp.]